MEFLSTFLLFLQSTLLDIKVYPFTFELAIEILAIVILLIASALIAATEIAFFSLNHQQIEAIENENSNDKVKILNQIENPKRLLGAVLISHTFVNITIVLISSQMMQSWFDFGNEKFWGFFIQIILVTSLILLFGEITPKIYARHNAVKFVHLMVKPMIVVQFFLKPLIFILIKSTHVIDHRIQKRRSQISMSELSEALDLTATGDDLISITEELKILKGIATFGETEVKEIMKARVDVIALDNEKTFDEVLKFIQKWGYSRLPVYDGHFDKVIGILHIKDLLGFLEHENYLWQEKIRPAFFVPENKKINDLLQEFKQKRIHLAIVVDEYGGTSGIVTLEDVLEEIVGEISDEFDTESKDFVFTKVDENNWVFEAKTSLIDLCKIVDVDIEYFDMVKGESDSIAGLLLEIKGDFPKEKEVISFEKFNFKVLTLDQRRIKRIGVERINY